MGYKVVKACLSIQKGQDPTLRNPIVRGDLNVIIGRTYYLRHITLMVNIKVVSKLCTYIVIVRENFNLCYVKLLKI